MHLLGVSAKMLSSEISEVTPVEVNESVDTCELIFQALYKLETALHAFHFVSYLHNHEG